MPTAKAKYLGDGIGQLIPDFSDALKEKLHAFYPDKSVELDEIWEPRADAFVEEILAEAWWAKSALHALEFDLTKAEIQAEHADLLKTLHAVESKLRNLSPGLDRLLNINADPLGCADQVALLAQYVSDASEVIKRSTKARKPIEKQYEIVVELACRVLKVLPEHKIPVAATGDCYFGYTSDAVKILKLIGDDLGLVRDELTWRDIISKTKSQKS